MKQRRDLDTHKSKMVGLARSADGVADAVVIGAGIIGSSLAYFLANLGLSVVVFDKTGAPGGATAGTHSNLSLHNRVPGPLFDFGLETYEFLANSVEELGYDVEFTKHGSLLLVADSDLVPLAKERVAAQQAGGLDISFLGQDELLQCDETLSPALVGGAYCPLSATINALLTSIAFQRAAMSKGARFYHHSPVTAIECNKAGAVEVVRSKSLRIATPVVINAAGLGAQHVAAMVGLDLPLFPNRGHIIITERWPSVGVGMKGEFVPKTVDTPATDPEERRWSARFVFSRNDGHYFIGRCGEPGARNSAVDPRAVRAIISRASQFVPSLAGMNVLRVFTGVRPYSSDKLPVLGASMVDGYYFAAGYGDKGIGHFITTKYLASEIVTGRVTPELEPFRYDRFLDAGN